MQSSFERSAFNWLKKLSNGDESAVDRVFRKYFDRLVASARKKMFGMNEAAYSSEDVAMSAMRSFCRGVREQKFTIDSEEDLWGVLFTITTRKACAERRRSLAQKRGGKGVGADDDAANVAVVRSGDSFNEEEDLVETVAGNEPSPELAAQTAEAAEELLSLFRDPTTRRIIELKLRGLTYKEIANDEQVKLGERTVGSRLKRAQIKILMVKDFECLFENALSGESLESAAAYVDLEAETATLLVEKAYDLWKKTTERSLATALYNMLFSREIFYEKARSGDPRAENLLHAIGSIINAWVSNSKSIWFDDLESIIKNDAKYQNNDF